MGNFISNMIGSNKPKEENNEKATFNGIVLGGEIIKSGTYYTDSTNLSTIGGTGPQSGPLNCKVDIITNNGEVTNITIHSGGFGYTNHDTLIVVGGKNNCTFRAIPVI